MLNSLVVSLYAKAVMSQQCHLTPPLYVKSKASHMLRSTIHYSCKFNIPKSSPRIQRILHKFTICRGFAINSTRNGRVFAPYTKTKIVAASDDKIGEPLFYPQGPLWLHDIIAFQFICCEGEGRGWGGHFYLPGGYV